MHDIRILSAAMSCGVVVASPKWCKQVLSSIIAVHNAIQVPSNLVFFFVSSTSNYFARAMGDVIIFYGSRK